MNFIKAKIFVPAIFLIYFTSVHGLDQEEADILSHLNTVMESCLNSNYTGIYKLYGECRNDEKPVVDLARNIKTALVNNELVKSDNDCARGIISRIQTMVQDMNNKGYTQHWKIDKDNSVPTKKSTCEFCKDIYRMAANQVNNVTAVNNLFDGHC